jgi:hypothetical protein
VTTGATTFDCHWKGMESFSIGYIANALSKSTKEVFYIHGSVELVTHYDLWSGFPYYNLTILIRGGTPYQPPRVGVE